MVDITKNDLQILSLTLFIIKVDSMPRGLHNHSENVTPEQSFLPGPELSQGADTEAGGRQGRTVTRQIIFIKPCHSWSMYKEGLCRDNFMYH